MEVRSFSFDFSSLSETPSYGHQEARNDIKMLSEFFRLKAEAADYIKQAKELLSLFEQYQHQHQPITYDETQTAQALWARLNTKTIIPSSSKQQDTQEFKDARSGAL
eukprot:TRINITY_DN8186_c0_g1_i1.p1 TRINITY_DN8186_c0_g1~~TRINITY_DN8186_c0_g1_i1.p1  ORF type:complete len:107 (-),score=12.85 TRINITY_DN8186_c0_g1_i1:92-412(-)